MVPNSNIEVERNLLGCLLEDNSLINLVARYNKELFYSTVNQNIFDAIKEEYKARNLVDIYIIAEGIKNKKYNFVPSDLTECLNTGGSTQSFNAYLEIVLENYHKRIIKKSVATIDYSEEPLVIVNKVLNELQSINTNKEVSTKEAIFDVVNTILSKEKPKGLKVGMRLIDEMCGGFKGGQLITIGARSGVGKTTIALNMFLHLIKTNNKAHYFSLEMPREAMLEKLLAIELRVPFRKLENCEIDGIEEKIALKANYLASKKFEFYDKQNNILDITSRIRAEFLAGNLDIAFIDLINRVTTTDRTATRAEEIGKMTRAFKQLALELKIPIVILAQINRGVEGRQDKRPVMSDLKESGSIEEDSDLVIGLYRNTQISDVEYVRKNTITLDYNSMSADLNPNRIEVLILKNRYGGYATSSLRYEGEINRISDLER